MPETRERWRFRLPHWEVADRPHFVTIRCAGSLPTEAFDRVREIHHSLRLVEPSSTAFAALQRKYFLLSERYLDAGGGFCPFHEPTLCATAAAGLTAFSQRHGWRVSDFTLMPNHVHLLLIPEQNAQPLKQSIRGWKWHIAKEANRLLGRSGAFWQSDWFDRWARTDSEAIRMRDYIRQNPVKAGLVSRWEDYPWTRSAPAPVVFARSV